MNTIEWMESIKPYYGGRIFYTDCFGYKGLTNAIVFYGIKDEAVSESQLKFTDKKKSLPLDEKRFELIGYMPQDIIKSWYRFVERASFTCKSLDKTRYQLAHLAVNDQKEAALTIKHKNVACTYSGCINDVENGSYQIKVNAKYLLEAIKGLLDEENIRIYIDPTHNECVLMLKNSKKIALVMGFKDEN